MAKKEIKLPRIFEDRFQTNPHLVGKPKISYSQYSSYKDTEYQDQYYLQYFSGIKLESGEFALMGTSAGQYIEDLALGEESPRKGCLSDEDCKVILDNIEFQEGCVYEDEIVLDCGEFCVEGYADKIWYKDNKEVEVLDFKTLNLDKPEKYQTEAYGQTALYSYKKELEGYKVVKASVGGIGRKGSSLDGTGNFKMRLSGEYREIPTPYTKERGERVVEDIKQVVEQISEEYKIYLKYFGEKQK